MKHYFIFKDGSQIGPLSKEELIEIKITKDTLVWFEGIETWVKAETIDELSICFIPTPPPPPIPIIQKPTIETSKEPEKQTGKKRLTTTHQIILYSCISIILVCGIIITTTLFKSNYNKGKHEGKQEVIEEVNAQVDEIENQNKINEDRNKREVANNFEKYFKIRLSYTANNLFGGLSNIKVTLDNNSKYRIDNMIVHINVYRSSGSFYKKFPAIFKNIKGNSSKTISLQNTAWGVKAEHVIFSVTSNEIGLNYEGVNITPNI